MNNNKIDIINEQFGNFMMAPTIPPPPTSISSTPHIIDNNVLYKKLNDLEAEIKSLKGMISSMHFPSPTYYPTQPYPNRPMYPPNYVMPATPMSHNINNHINMKPNQPNLY